MAESITKTEQDAEKAYAEAASEAAPAKAAAPAAEHKPIKAEEPAAEAKPAPAAARSPAATKVRKAPAKRAVKPAAHRRKPAARTKAKPADTAQAGAKPKAARKPKAASRAKAAASPAAVKAARRAARVAKAAAKPPVSKVSITKPTVTQLKEKIMATTKTTTDFAKPIVDAFGEVQTRAKAAYDKGTEVATEVTEFAKGNVEAFVESSKIFASGAQTLGKTYVEEAKSAYETMTGDVKEMAAVKSPAELFQLQGKIMRRNFDMLVATTSKNSEAVMKLANESIAPLSGRVNVAAEKLAKVA